MTRLPIVPPTGRAGELAFTRRSFLTGTAVLATSALLPRAGRAQTPAPASSADGLDHLFPGFEETWFKIGPYRLFARIGGPSGAPAVLLLHGFPESHFSFHPIAPQLAETNRVFASISRATAFRRHHRALRITTPTQNGPGRTNVLPSWTNSASSASPLRDTIEALKSAIAWHLIIQGGLSASPS